MIYNFRDKENHSFLKIGKRYLFSDVLQEEKNYKVEWVEGFLDKIEKHPNSANCFVSNNRYFLYCKEILSEQKKLTFCISFDDIIKVLYKKVDRKKVFK